MSYYCFFASDKEMPEFDNMKANPIIVDGEVVAIEFAKAFDERNAMRIIKEDDLYYARKFTDKKYVNFIEWYYNDQNAQVIVDYVKLLLKDRFSVTLFNTWMEDESKLIIKKVNVNELEIGHIKDIWGKPFFEGNECLIVSKSYWD